MPSKETLTKAPNILILTECDKEFASLRNFLRNLLGINSYTIYNLTMSQLSLTPRIWMSNCRLLITTASEEFVDSEWDFIKSYLNIDGRVLTIPKLKSLAVSMVVNEDKFAIFPKKFYFESSYEENGLSKTYEFADLIYSYQNSNSTHWVSKIYPVINDIDSSDKDELYKYENVLNKLYYNLLTQTFQLQEIKNEKYEILHPQPYLIISKNKLLQSVNVIENYLRDSLTKDVELCVNGFGNEVDFNQNEYFQALKTKKLGQIVLFSDVVTSTMNALKTLPNSMDNIVVIANHQIDGQGNGKNEWISPIGCAMFTLYLNLNAQSFSPSRLCLLQYATALSCVEAIKQTPGYENVPIQIKWPNDIFYGRTSKLGGILVKSSIMSDYFNIKIGVGLNVNNEHPTFCLNKVFEEHNLEKWSTELFIAKTLNKLEEYVEYLQNSTTLDTFLEKYTKLWIHQDQTVRVDYWNEDVKIIGIDIYGFLKVKRQNNEIHVLQPDGNRFDLMHNLIVFK